MKNIYDETIELENEIKENRLQLTKEKYRDLDDIKLSKIIKSKSDKHDKIIKALERAKKVEELLGLKNEKIALLQEKCGCISAVALKMDKDKNKNRWNEIDKYMHRLNDKITNLEKELEGMMND